MPRIIVTTDLNGENVGQPVLLEEHIRSVHLSTRHAAAQLVERLAWAIVDAETSEAKHGGRAPDADVAARALAITDAGSLSPAMPVSA